MWRRGQADRDAIEGTAVIIASEPDSRGTAEAGQAGTHPLDFGLNVLGSHGYRLVLEVRLPGREPYEVAGRFKVPRRAENASLVKRAVSLQAGIELPVRVEASDPQAVEVDWKRFIDDPGRRAQLEKRQQQRQQEVLHERLASNPKLQAKLQAGGKQQAPAWAAAVRGGAMSREQFEQTVEGEVRAGRMDPADAEAARASLDT